MRPSIDQGAAGSKSVKVNRSAIWHIKCKGEPPPKFSWYKDGELLENGDDIKIETKEYQGGATALMQIVKSKMSDAGVYNFITEWEKIQEFSAEQSALAVVTRGHT